MSQERAHPGGHRSVRTYVKRTGRITVAQSRALAELWPQYRIDFSEERLNFDDIFGRSAARVLEIGFGDGESLVQQAAENRHVDYLGLEVHEPGAGHCMLLANRSAIANLRIMIHDALEVLEHQVPGESLDRINLYFPDPWPKKRHHKRRIVRREFLQLASGKLKPGGSLHIATDWKNYSEHIDDVLASTTLFSVAERREHSGENALDRPMTKFEKRGLGKGHRIWDWRLVRNSF